MSLVCQKPLCRVCQSTCRVVSKGVAMCDRCQKTFYFNPPPEPTIEELSAEITRANARRRGYELASGDTEYNRLVQQSMQIIQREERYLTELKYNHGHTDEMIAAVDREIASLVEQRKMLMVAEIAKTRSTSGISKISLETKLREKLGQEVYEKLKSVLGTDEKIREVLASV